MLVEEVKTALGHTPFIPLRMHLTNGKTLDIPFQHVVVPMRSHVIVFKGVKEAGSHVAKGYDVVGYGLIDRIEPRKRRKSR